MIAAAYCHTISSALVEVLDGCRPPYSHGEQDEAKGQSTLGGTSTSYVRAKQARAVYLPIEAVVVPPAMLVGLRLQRLQCSSRACRGGWPFWRTLHAYCLAHAGCTRQTVASLRLRMLTRWRATKPRGLRHDGEIHRFRRHV